MDKLLEIIGEIDIPSAYDHFAEGEAVDPPFITYLTCCRGQITSRQMGRSITR